MAGDDAEARGAHELRRLDEILFAKRRSFERTARARPGQSRRPRMTVMPEKDEDRAQIRR